MNSWDEAKFVPDYEEESPEKKAPALAAGKRNQLVSSEYCYIHTEYEFNPNSVYRLPEFGFGLKKRYRHTSPQSKFNSN
jgi:hypothetical protein